MRLSNLRPTAVRSFMERRLTMASTPIIRYYDHLRLVYEVESRMREMRQNNQGEAATDRLSQQRRGSQNKTLTGKMADPVSILPSNPGHHR